MFFCREGWCESEGLSRLKGETLFDDILLSDESRFTREISIDFLFFVLTDVESRCVVWQCAHFLLQTFVDAERREFRSVESFDFMHYCLLGNSFLVPDHFLCPMEFEIVVLSCRLFGIAEHDICSFFNLVEFFVEFRFECLSQRCFEVLWLVLLSEVYADR